MESNEQKFLVRTFGCQMNEHDSERLAGLLSEEARMAPATDEADADVIVLNTCCIRENADNKLYGTLGHLKSLKDERPDLRIVVMSATLTAEPVARLLGGCPIVSADGRLFPVEVRYGKRGERRDLVELVAAALPEALTRTDGRTYRRVFLVSA